MRNVRNNQRNEMSDMMRVCMSERTTIISISLTTS